MSDYQQRKARALEIQREKDLALKVELEAKAAKDKQRSKEEEEKRKQRDAAAREARRLELIRANEALTKKKDGPSNTDGEGDWNPFAEVERLPTTPSIATLLPKVKKTNGTTKVISNPNPGPSSRAGPSKPRSEAKKTREDSPPLSRKEKAAKLFAQKAKKSSSTDSIFNVRALVESRDGPQPRLGPSSPGRAPIKNSKSAGLHSVKLGNGVSIASNSAESAGRVKDRMNAIARNGEMRKLCPDRDTRDRRTIDEIHTDIKSRRNPAMDGPVSNVPPRKPKPAIPSSARPSSTLQARSRRRSQSSASSSSTDDDRPPRKRRPKDFDEDEEDEPVDFQSHAKISAEIQAMFRRPGRPPPLSRDYISEDEGSSDMEAGLSDVEMEERRTAAIARREDEIAEREERERKLAKERLKKDKDRGKR